MLLQVVDDLDQILEIQQHLYKIVREMQQEQILSTNENNTNNLILFNFSIFTSKYTCAILETVLAI